LQSAAFRFPVNTPDSKEAYMYRVLFEEHFGNNESVVRTVPFEKSVACSTAKALEWDESFRLLNEPSGRAVGVHRDAIGKADGNSG
jgi:asparagine synthase (glutamine-hydrolysing)